MATASAPARINPFPGNSSRAIAYAAIEPRKTAIRVAIAAMPSEFAQRVSEVVGLEQLVVVVERPGLREEVAVADRGRSFSESERIHTTGSSA